MAARGKSNEFRLTKGAVRAMVSGESRTHDPVTLQVLAVMRYEVDASVPAHLRGKRLMDGSKESERKDELYDVLVHDGSHQARCLLNITLNRLAEKNVLHRFAVLSVNIHRLLEVGDDRQPLVILDSFRVLPGSSTFLGSQDLKDITPGEHSDFVPLLTSRGFYSPRWCEDGFPFVEADAQPDASVPGAASPHPFFLSALTDAGLSHVELDDARKRLDITAVIEGTATGSVGGVQEGELSYLVCRVVAKKRMRHFARFTNSSYNFSFTFTVHDGTAAVDVVVWGRACLLYYCLHVGQTVLLTNYTPRFSRLIGAYELHINEVNDNVGSIYAAAPGYAFLPKPSGRLEDGSIGPDALLDLRVVQLKRKSLWSTQVADGRSIDYLACLSFVGRVERELGQKGFSQYRWVKAVDMLEPGVEHCIKVYANSQLAFHRMQVGDFFLFLHLSFSSIFCDPRRPRFLYMVSTFESQYLRLSASFELEGYSSDSRKIVATAWAKRVAAATAAKQSPTRVDQERGTVLLACKDLAVTQDTFGNLPLIRFSDFGRTCDLLHHQEYRPVLLQGFLGSISEAGDAKTNLTMICIILSIVSLDNLERQSVRCILAVDPPKVRNPTLKDYYSQCIMSLLSFFPSQLFTEAALSKLRRFRLPEQLRSVAMGRGSMHSARSLAATAVVDALDATMVQQTNLVFLLHLYRAGPTSVEMTASEPMLPNISSSFFPS